MTTSSSQLPVFVRVANNKPGPIVAMAQRDLPAAFTDSFEFFCSKMRRKGTTGGVGLIYDKYNLNRNVAVGPISIGSTGFGMMVVCIGSALGLTTKTQAIELTLETLTTLLGERAGFTPKRSNSTKFFGHFLHPDTGALANNSEISTIDTALMAAGAMFARNYLQDARVTQKTNFLVQGIDWGAAFRSDEWMSMVMDPDTGRPDWSKGTRPFNEYFVLAYVGKIVEEEMKKDGPATAYFKRYFYNPPHSIPQLLKSGGAAEKEYSGYKLWSDNQANFASSFQVQFCYYLSKFFQTNPTYQEIFRSQAAADKKYFQDKTRSTSAFSSYQWGCGAGEYPQPRGYFAAAIENNDKLVYSAPIIAGFFPAETSSLNIAEALKQLYDNNVCTFNVDGKKVLWRRSLVETSWSPTYIQSVDFSTLLLGYAWKCAGAKFFSDNAI